MSLLTLPRRHSRRLAAAWLLACAAAPAVLTGCAQAPTTRTAPTPWVAATSTSLWNDHANDLIARNGSGQVGALRTLAYVNLAIHNALAEAAQDKASADGAVSGAAATVLLLLFPKDEAATTARLQREIQALGSASRAGFQAGVELGRKVGAQVNALARADRVSGPWTGTVPAGEDKWSSRAQPPAAPLAPALGKARTFLLRAGDEFRAPPPPAWGSEAWRAQLQEVRSTSDGRTVEQLRIAQHWENLTGAFAAGTWNVVARNAMAARGTDEATTARVLATMHMAGFDGVVACHDSKYAYWVPRPTQVDPAIVAAIALPNHPSYPSNHSCISGSMGRVLDAALPDARGMYQAMGRQAGLSRLYGGIHYQMDLDAGEAIANRIAARALASGPAAGRGFKPAGQ